MADHIALMTGRLLTESTLQSTIHVPSMHDVADDGRPRTRSGALVDCRVCQEEDDEAYMETPCTCKGSLKYAHRKCTQRWCNEKVDTACEICLQQFTPNYTTSLKMFKRGRSLINFRRNREGLEVLNPGYVRARVMETTDQTSVPATSYDYQSSSPKGAIYCRMVAINVMSLLVFRDAFSVIFGSAEAHSVVPITFLMFRTAGIVTPIYIILISVTPLLHQYNQQTIQRRATVSVRLQAVHEPVSEPGGAEGVQPLPLPLSPLQHVVVE